MLLISLIVLFILLILLIISKYTKEGFLSDYCSQNKDCKSCANSSGCSWCPTDKICLMSTSLKSTDKSCNQMNSISSTFRCESEIENKIPPDSVVEKDILYDYTLFRNQIANKIPPPNVYTTEHEEYSPETIMGNMNNIQNDLSNYQQNIPDIIASTVQNQIKPMVKGILSDNYYIQA